MTLTRIAGVRIFSNGLTIDHTVEYKSINWAVRRYGYGYQVNDPRGVGHLGVLGEIQQEALNGRLNTGTMPNKAGAVLKGLGLEGEINDLDYSDLHFARSENGYSAMRVILDDIRATTPAPEPPDIEEPGEVLGQYPGAPPHNRPVGGGGPETVFERIAIYGLIMASTPYDGPLPSQMGFARRYWQNKLVPNVNEAEWMLAERGLRPLPEQSPVREDGIYLYDQLECRIAEWGLALAEGTDDTGLQDAALRAYWEFEPAFVPKTIAGAPPAFQDRRCNPRSVLYASRMLENAIVQGKPDYAAWCGPRAAFSLGTPQHMSRYEQWGFSSQPLQSRDWRGVLGLSWAEGDEGGTGGIGIGGN